MIYLDYAATTPIAPLVLERYMDIEQRYFANTMALHILGEQANAFYENQKKQLLDLLGTKQHDVIYVSNATEANNLALLGYLKGKKGNFLYCPMEHSSLDEAIKVIKNKDSLDYQNIEAIEMAVDSNGLIDLEDVKSKINKNTLLIVCQWVNNVVGMIEPIKELLKIAHSEPRTKLLVDIVQGIGKVKPNFKLDDVDMMSFSTHKIYGPKGVGCLIYKKNLSISPLLYGAKDQKGLKPGTFDPALVASTTEAMRFSLTHLDEHLNYVTQLNNKIREYINRNININNIESIVINSPVNSTPYILNISFPHHNGETIIHYLENNGIYVSTGSACNSHLKTPERVLKCMGRSDDIALSSIRISLSYLTTEQEILDLCEALKCLI